MGLRSRRKRAPVAQANTASSRARSKLHAVSKLQLRTVPTESAPAEQRTHGGFKLLRKYAMIPTLFRVQAVSVRVMCMYMEGNWLLCTHHVHEVTERRDLCECVWMCACACACILSLSLSLSSSLTYVHAHAYPCTHHTYTHTPSQSPRHETSSKTKHKHELSESHKIPKRVCMHAVYALCVCVCRHIHIYKHSHTHTYTLYI